MISRSDLPERIEELAALEFDLPRLAEDSPESCPVPLAELLDYLRLESADPDAVTSQQLSFARTVLINDRQYWVWRFVEPDGEECYAWVGLSPDGVTSLSMASSFASLNPEQWAVADLFQYV
jgi:hypothetical protein